MRAYAIYYENFSNLVGVVTSESERDEDDVIDLFRLHYPEYVERFSEEPSLFVGPKVKHVHTK